MSTQIPPAPKRQRTTAPAAVAAKEAMAAPVQTVICQFRNAQDGTLLGPAVSLPADTGREGLELLVNNLRGTVSRPPVLPKPLLAPLTFPSLCTGRRPCPVLFPPATAFDSNPGRDRRW